MADLPGIFMLRGKAPGDKPADGRLRAGEIGINEYDKILFLHDPSSTAPIEIHLAGLGGVVNSTLTDDLFKENIVETRDWDDFTEPGPAKNIFAGASDNSPVNRWMRGFNCVFSNTITQFATPFNWGDPFYDGIKNKRWVRYFNGAWSPWICPNSDAETVGGLTPAQLRGVRVQNHVTTAHIYAAAADLQIDALNTAISCSAGDTVQITATINFEANHEGVFYLKRNNVEIGSAGAASHSGLCAVPFDSDTNTTMSNVSFSYIDESPIAGLNAYTFHKRGDSAPFYLNRTLNGDTGTSRYNERAASTIILET